MPTPEERRLSRIGKAELPDEKQVYDPVFSGSGHARTVGVRETRTMNLPDERTDEEGGGDPGKNAEECGLGGSVGGATSPRVDPFLKGTKRKGNTVETKARLLELLGQDGKVTDEAVREAAKITKYTLVKARKYLNQI